MIQWIRPIVTLIAVLGLTIGFFLDKINSEAYLAIMAITITWWFKSRDETKKIGG